MNWILYATVDASRLNGGDFRAIKQLFESDRIRERLKLDEKLINIF